VWHVTLLPAYAHNARTGLLWWWGLFSWGLLANTPVLSLVVLLDAAVPTAQNVVMLLLVHGHPEHGHVSALFSWPGPDVAPRC
jgi:hypothetical protein